MRWGILLRAYSFWVGWHYSKRHKRWCINFFPMVTIWIVEKGGDLPLGEL